MSSFTLTGKYYTASGEISATEETLIVEYNPSVTGVKRVVSESIVQTLGSKYPFIRRNSKTNYWQCNIGGLISVASLPQDKTSFCGMVDIIPGIGGTGYDNISNEARFRLAVVDFLTNGLEKTFWSKTEGEYRVYLSNVSLTPEKQLGRLIYSFTAQAIEVEA